LKLFITVVAALVAVLAIASGATAAGKYLITSSSQVKDGAISLADLSPAVRKAVQAKGSNVAVTSVAGPQGSNGDTGEKGKDGAPGATGARGPQGSAGTSGYEVKTWRYSKDDANSDSGPGYVGVGSGAIATVACSPGKVALSGGYRFTSDGGSGFNSPAVADGSGVVASFPGRMDWTTNTVKPNDNSGWIVQVNSEVNAADMTLYVVCANVN
jgi:hypothetical protein